MIKMSVHMALTKLKNFDERIKKDTFQDYCTLNKGSNTKINGETIESAKSRMQGNFDKISAMIRNRNLLKSAIVASNAATKVEIGGVWMTVAEAIERKSSIKAEEVLLQHLKNQFCSVNAQMQRRNDELESKLNEYLKVALGENPSQDDKDKEIKRFYATHGYQLIDPIGLQDVIAEMEENINAFKTEVDGRLSESNAQTFVEVDLAD